MYVPLEKLDCVTYSWQKAMGGEGQHGVVIFSPSAIKRLNTYTPSRPLPKIFRLKSKNQVNNSFFDGATINTPSMLCVEDALDAMAWVESIGGLSGAVKRSENNLEVVKHWVKDSHWIDFLCDDHDNLSSTSICLKIKDKSFLNLGEEIQKSKIKEINTLLEKENVDYDIN